ncbi:MAG: DUF2279 domain-containing protein [Bacteroidia bacterium]|nr:DUF2279 domain-containing protein [Bacteroidia bacterium]
MHTESKAQGVGSEVDSARLFKKRKTLIIAGNAVGYSATMFGLYNLWYKDYPLTSFHFHNDNRDWNQMDKVGHAYSCYYEGVVGIDMMKWAGYSHKTASILGGSYGFLIQGGIEVFDGFSEAWGASSGDLIANAVGSSLAIGQSLAWDEQRIWMKLSYQPSEFAAIRPELLGSSFVESLFKDYNGQTYWLSGNIRSFIKDETKFPAWLNIAVGYGINGFVSSDDNLFERDGQQFDYTHIPQSRQFYLSPDIDLTRIKTDNKALKISLRLLNCLKFPMPGLGYDSKSQKFSFNMLQF